MESYKMFQTLKQFLVNADKSQDDIAIVTKAYEYAAEMHKGQYRKDGDEYICHPLAVAQICANFRYDIYCICAALLHDVIEDCPDKTTLKEINKLFGERVAALVDGLTKLKGMYFHTKEEESIKNLRKMFFADIRVILIKLADRMHNMRTLKSLPEYKQREKARETLEVYAPIAHRLGMSKVGGPSIFTAFIKKCVPRTRRWIRYMTCSPCGYWWKRFRIVTPRWAGCIRCTRPSRGG
jgi:GTP pyrophosphokinase